VSLDLDRIGRRFEGEPAAGKPFLDLRLQHSRLGKGTRKEGNGVNFVSKLRHDENVRLDPDRLVALYAELGEAGAERLIGAAMEELAVRIALVQKAAQAGQVDRLGPAVEKLHELAEQVGMQALARVGQDVLNCAQAGDGAGVAATVARLVRIGDRSLTAVWDLQDMTI